MNNDEIKLHDGCITMTVLALANTCQLCAYDFPAFVSELGLCHLFPDEDPTMWPTIDDVRIIANAIDLPDDDAREQFIADFPLEWDT